MLTDYERNGNMIVSTGLGIVVEHMYSWVEFDKEKQNKSYRLLLDFMH